MPCESEGIGRDRKGIGRGSEGDRKGIGRGSEGIGRDPQGSGIGRDRKGSEGIRLDPKEDQRGSHLEGEEAGAHADGDAAEAAEPQHGLDEGGLRDGAHARVGEHLEDLAARLDEGAAVDGDVAVGPLGEPLDAALRIRREPKGIRRERLCCGGRWSAIGRRL